MSYVRSVRHDENGGGSVQGLRYIMGLEAACGALIEVLEVRRLSFRHCCNIFVSKAR